MAPSGRKSNNEIYLRFRESGINHPSFCSPGSEETEDQLRFGEEIRRHKRRRYHIDLIASR